MPSMNDAFPSRYLSAEDLRGQDHTVVIERYQAETMPARDGADDLLLKKRLPLMNNGKKFIKGRWKFISGLRGTMRI